MVRPLGVRVGERVLPIEQDLVVAGSMFLCLGSDPAGKLARAVERVQAGASALVEEAAAAGKAALLAPQDMAGRERLLRAVRALSSAPAGQGDLLAVQVAA